MFIALFSILGIVVGASLHYVFSRFLEGRKHLRLLQTEAYADYLRGVAEAAHHDLTVSEVQIHARIANARARIALYGSPNVVTLLADFEKAGNAIITNEQHEAFICLVKAMRGDDHVENAALELVLMGSPKANQLTRGNEGPKHLEFFNLMRSAMSRAITIGIMTVYYNDPNAVNTWLDKIDAVTKEDVQRVAKNFLGQNNRSVIATMPKGQ